ncbi:hypothetical protein BDY21DRAFT_105455 [Lineolata rhizophorae]|uniref:Uncharacterized protein n=1 Tax=Lineolata rhizophorae TaxID=578093 RepID=A0A6A6NRY6_9PEZI|nr:hypothetical protein BDY21DRAFT_105455 [Lineolata rhizophorae]
MVNQTSLPLFCLRGFSFSCPPGLKLGGRGRACRGLRTLLPSFLCFCCWYFGARRRDKGNRTMAGLVLVQRSLLVFLSLVMPLRFGKSSRRHAMLDSSFMRGSSGPRRLHGAGEDHPCERTRCGAHVPVINHALQSSKAELEPGSSAVSGKRQDPCPSARRQSF